MGFLIYKTAHKFIPQCLALIGVQCKYAFQQFWAGKEAFLSGFAFEQLEDLD